MTFSTKPAACKISLIVFDRLLNSLYVFVRDALKRVLEKRVALSTSALSELMTVDKQMRQTVFLAADVPYALGACYAVVLNGASYRSCISIHALRGEGDR